MSIIKIYNLITYDVSHFHEISRTTLKEFSSRKPSTIIAEKPPTFTGPFSFNASGCELYFANIKRTFPDQTAASTGSRLFSPVENFKTNKSWCLVFWCGPWIRSGRWHQNYHLAGQCSLPQCCKFPVVFTGSHSFNASPCELFFAHVKRTFPGQPAASVSSELLSLVENFKAIKT